MEYGQIQLKSPLFYLQNVFQQDIQIQITEKDDIIKNVYEGGFKVWECTIDLLEYMDNQNLFFHNKKILDVGCGHGLLGIYSIKRDAQFCLLQDFNKEVLNICTMSNLNQNQIDNQKYGLMHGDWDYLQFQEQYDILFMSEVIYHEENYLKICNLIKKAMKKDGICYMASKVFYYGVGGSLYDFMDFLENNQLQYETVWKNYSKTTNKREIIKIFF